MLHMTEMSAKLHSSFFFTIYSLYLLLRQKREQRRDNKWNPLYLILQISILKLQIRQNIKPANYYFFFTDQIYLSKALFRHWILSLIVVFLLKMFIFLLYQFKIIT